MTFIMPCLISGSKLPDVGENRDEERHAIEQCHTRGISNVIQKTVRRGKVSTHEF